MSCSPTLEEKELTPLRYLDPDTATPAAEEESAQDPWLQEDPWSRRPGVESAGRSTDSKKNTVQRIYVSKLIDRQHPPLWPCNTMTPVAPALQLSSEANAIVAAINGALAPRLDGIQGQMGLLAGQMTSLKSDVVQHDQRMSDSWKILRLGCRTKCRIIRGETEACILPKINVQCCWWVVSPTTRRGI